jgi:hypothetical protein
MTEERKYPDINNLYKEAYDTAYMEASIRAASPQQPVAWLIDIDGVPKFIDPDTKRRSFKDWVAKPLFFATTSPKRPWVGLTDEEIWEWFRDNTALTNESGIRIVRAIEAKLKEKNT